MAGLETGGEHSPAFSSFWKLPPRLGLPAPHLLALTSAPVAASASPSLTLASILGATLGAPGSSRLSPFSRSLTVSHLQSLLRAPFSQVPGMARAHPLYP